MSEIALTALASYRRKGGRVQVLHGGLDARIEDSGHLQILADSVPFRSSRFKSRQPRPGYGMLLLYGFKDAAEECALRRAEARQAGAEFTSAEVIVDVGEIATGLVDRRLLKDKGDAMRFVNVRRMVADLQEEILQRFARYVAEEGGRIKQDMNRVRQIAERPDLFDRLLQDDRDFQHIDVIVVPVADDPARPLQVRQLAYLRAGATIVEIKQGTLEASLVLPAWMTDETAMRAARRKVRAMEADSA